MEINLRALLIEDNETDASLIQYYLRKANFNVIYERIETAAEMASALKNKVWDIVLCDYNLPHFNALEALQRLQESGFDIPFIIVSGAIGEEMTVNMMKAGAHDCVMKNNLKRLSPVITRELAEADVRRKHKRVEQFQKILHNITNAVLSTNNLTAFIRIIRDQLGSIIDTTNFFIAMYDEKSDSISLPYMADQKDNIISFPAGKTLTSYVIKTKKPLLATRSVLDKLEEEKKIETVGEKAKVWLGVPLITFDKVIGVVAVQSYDNENAYSKNDLEFLQFVSDHIIISIERKKAEQELRVSLAKAEESDRLKTAFLANMSHEIRTPMVAIIGFSELLEDESLTIEERREYINIINSSCRDLLNVLDGIIDIAKIDSNQMFVNESSFNLNTLLTELHKEYENEKSLIGKDNLVIYVEHPPADHNYVINSDRDKLRQIIKNLLSNALKFTEEGSITFGYSKQEGKLHFFVKDTGKGIAATMQSVIFEKFRQEEEQLSRSFGGTGLGLSISKGLVDLLGGEIWLVSSEGQGTTFFFTIPNKP